MQTDQQQNKQSDRNSSKYIHHYIEVPACVDLHRFTDKAIHLLSLVIHKQEYNKHGKATHHWVPVARNFLIETFGKDGCKILKELTSAGVLQLKKVGNDTYSIQNGVHPGVCQQVCLSRECWEDVKNKKLQIFRTKSPRIYFNGKPKENIVIKSPKMGLKDLVKLNYNRVTLDDAWQNLWSVEAICDSDRNLLLDRSWAKKIGTGDFDVTLADNGRLYHPIIMMRRELRPFLRYKNEKIVKLDVKACHPFMLATFADESDKSHWLEICMNDVYNHFVDDNHDRELVKELFQMAISHKKKIGVALKISEFIKREAPSIYRHFEKVWAEAEKNGSHHNTIQYELQKLESRIFVDRVYSKMASKIWILPMHDGCMVEEYNVKKVRKLIEAESEKILGFKLIIEQQ
jgi:hypothetical protein